MTIDVKKLHETLKSAQAAALEANKIEDGGTCNFDTAVLHIPEEEEAAVIQAAEGTGISVHRRDWMCNPGEVAVFLHADGCGGQGSARTKSAEAICNTLTAAEFPAMMYYQMD